MELLALRPTMAGISGRISAGIRARKLEGTCSGTGWVEHS
jgi:hypothetical protein